MRIPFKIKGKTETIEFSLSPNKDGGFAVIAKSTKDLDKLQDLISSENSTMAVQKGIQKYIESKLKLAVDINYNYPGAGYGFKIDMYSLLGKLK
jgi:hypothetical protein